MGTRTIFGKLGLRKEQDKGRELSLVLCWDHEGGEHTSRAVGKRSSPLCKCRTAGGGDFLLSAPNPGSSVEVTVSLLA